MVVLEEPYVSETLLNYLEKTQMPVLKNDFSVKQFSSHEKWSLKKIEAPSKTSQINF